MGEEMTPHNSPATELAQLAARIQEMEVRLRRLEEEMAQQGRQYAAGQKLPPEVWRRPQTSTTGVNALLGKWPGEETDEEILRALEEMS